MATTTTYGLNKPTVGGDENTWGGLTNDNWDDVDDLLDGTTPIKPDLDAGLWKVGGVAVTATAAELNILDGVTATTAELNILDGVTATAAELNKLDGVTWTLTNYNTLTATAAELNKLDGVTASTAELNILDGVTATAAELNKLDGAVITTTELNYLDNATGNIQAQINAIVSAGGANNSTITLSASSGLTGGGSFTLNQASPATISFSHSDTSSQTSVNNSGTTVIQDVTLDTYGHVTALGSATLALSSFGVTATSTELNYVGGVTSSVQTQLNSKAPLASPTFTGTPAAPTAAGGTNTTQLATTAFVNSEVGTANSALVKTALNASGSAPVYACRAWVNFNGTGTVAIRGSGNVSSITDNGTGDYRINFATAMQDTNYAIITSSNGFSATAVGRQSNSKSDQTTGPINKATTHCEVLYGVTSNGALADGSDINVAIFR